MTRIVHAGTSVTLDASTRVGQGGEGEVHRIAPGRAAKVFFDRMTPAKREKIARFPRGLPADVVGPEGLVLDTDGVPVGYEMRLVEGAVDIGVLASRRAREGILSSGWVSAFFARIARTVEEIHAAGVVVGDLNPGNVLFVAVPRREAAAAEIAFIDAESMQYDGFPCEVAHERFVDPVLYGKDFGKRPCFAPATDRYALAVLLFSSLLYLHPYGGVHPKHPTMLKRALARHSALRADVVLPRTATPPRVLTDDLLAYFHAVFDEGRREPIPAALLAAPWTRCTCGVEHARRACPVCSASVPVPVAVAPRQAGEVTCVLLFETKGAIVDATLRGGKLLWTYRTALGLFREDGAPVADRARPFHRPGDESFACDGGVLRRREAGTIVGRVLDAKTWVRAGDALGLGFYRPGRMAVFFLFDAHQGGLRDVEGMPLFRGRVTSCDAVFDGEHALFIATTEEAGKEHVLAVLVDRRGKVLAIEDAAAADEASPWVGAGRPALARGQVILATKDGLVLLRADPAARRFLVARAWKTGELGAADLYPGAMGSLFAVTANEIRTLIPA